jgi:hypothetical protein
MNLQRISVLAVSDGLSELTKSAQKKKASGFWPEAFAVTNAVVAVTVMGNSGSAELADLYFFGLRAFFALTGDIADGLAFGQSFEAGALDCAEVYEEVCAAVSRGDEAKTFAFVEPFNCTVFAICHIYIPASKRNTSMEHP